jgi:hypothetical protein
MITVLSRVDRPPRLRSPFARAVVPVLGGIVVLALIFGVMWAIAAFRSGGENELTERLAPSTFRVGRIDSVAEEIAEEGPIVFANLALDVERPLVLDHAGDDPARGWFVYYAYPEDRDPRCAVEQVEGSAEFVDCDGRTIDVTALAPPVGVHPVVVEQRDIVLDLREATTD